MASRAAKGRWDGRDMHLTADLRHLWICHLNAELDLKEIKFPQELAHFSSMQIIKEMLILNARTGPTQSIEFSLHVCV